MTTTNEDLHGDIADLRAQMETLTMMALQIQDHDKRIALLEAFRQTAEAFQMESKADRAQLKKAVEAMPGQIELQVKSAVNGELNSKDYVRRRQSETEQAMFRALRRIFNIKSVGGFFAMLTAIIVFAERIFNWLS